MRRLIPLFAFAALSVWAQTTPSSYTVRAIIGSGSRGDGGPAAQAMLDGPFGLAEDSDGNVYISESSAGVIRRVRLDGTIERFAGSGTLADGQEGAPALQTDLWSPTVLVFDREGALMFADTRACRIRKIDAGGIVRNVVGTGRCAGTATTGPGGGATGIRDTRALELDLGTVGGMAIDGSGRLIFTDETAHVVRRLDADGVVRVMGGTGTGGISGDTGAATSAQFRGPQGLTFDAAGNLYVADSLNCRVRRINSELVVETVAGNGTVSSTGACATASPTFTSGVAINTSLGRISGLAYDPDSNSILIGSPSQARVLRLDLNSSRVFPFLGNGVRGASEPAPPLQFSVDSPTSVIVSRRAGILVADSTSFAVLAIGGDTVTRFAGYWPQLDVYPAASAAPLVRPRGICMLAADQLAVLDAGAERVLSFQVPDRIASIAGARYPTGYTAGDGGPAAAAHIADPKRIACASNGDIYLTAGSQIRRITRAGTIQAVLGFVTVGGSTRALNDPFGLAFDAQGRLLFSEAGGHQVFRYDPAARTTTLVAGTGTSGFTGDGSAATDARLNTPGDLAVDAQGNIFISDRGNRRVRRISPNGIVQTVAGSNRAFWHNDTSGQLATEVGLDAVDGLAVDTNGNLYLSEYRRVSVVRTDGRIYILTGYLGEDNNGVSSYLDGPLNGCDAIAVDAAGRLYFTVRDGGRAMVATPPGIPLLDPGPPPAISPGGVLQSTAFGASGTIASGSWIEIYGSNLAAKARRWSAEDFSGGMAPTSLEGTSVSIAGRAAFLSYVSPTQVNAQVPTGLAEGSAELTVTTPAGTSGPYPVTVAAARPGLLAPATFQIGGRQYTAALLADGKTFALPSNAIPGVSSRPARPGELITLYGIGFGPVTPPVAAGESARQSNTLDLPVRILLGGVPAEVTYSGLAPGQVGLYQFNVAVPVITPGDATPLTFTLNGVSGTQTLYTAVGQPAVAAGSQ